MIVERRLQTWCRTVLARYAAEPQYVEQVFHTDDQGGLPSALTTTTLEDNTQFWLPDEWQGGELRLGGVRFAILSNTPTSLTLDADPSAVADLDTEYQIVSADVGRLTTYLQSRHVMVDVSYLRLPTVVPAITIRLESDNQAAAYIGESVDYTFNPALAEESSWFETDMEASYLLTIATDNPQETIWLYHLLVNAYLQSMQQFTLWGLHNLRLSGSDLHPDMQFIPEQVYSRYVSLRCTRVMRAVLLDTVDRVTRTDTVPTPHYAELDSKGDPPGTLPYGL
jgi:hypothetical protein